MKLCFSIKHQFLKIKIYMVVSEVKYHIPSHTSLLWLMHVLYLLSPELTVLAYGISFQWEKLQ